MKMGTHMPIHKILVKVVIYTFRHVTGPDAPADSFRERNLSPNGLVKNAAWIHHKLAWYGNSIGVEYSIIDAVLCAFQNRLLGNGPEFPPFSVEMILVIIRIRHLENDIGAIIQYYIFPHSFHYSCIGNREDVVISVQKKGTSVINCSEDIEDMLVTRIITTLVTKIEIEGKWYHWYRAKSHPQSPMGNFANKDKVFGFF
jgi:hypothetical protein